MSFSGMRDLGALTALPARERKPNQRPWPRAEAKPMLDIIPQAGLGREGNPPDRQGVLSYPTHFMAGW